MLQKIKKKENLSKTIVKALVEYIIINNLKSGDRLPTEKELVENFNVARTVVREALKAMEIIGLAHSTPGVGTTLSSGGVEPFLIPFLFGFDLEETGLEHLSEMRLIIEQGAARLAVSNASDEEFAYFLKYAQELDAQKEKTYASLTKANQAKLAEMEAEFHQRLVELSHNPILAKFGALWKIFFTRIKEAGRLKDASESFQRELVETASHVQIVDALSQRDEEKSMMMIKRHLTFWLIGSKSISKSSLVDLVNMA